MYNFHVSFFFVFSCCCCWYSFFFWFVKSAFFCLKFSIDRKRPVFVKKKKSFHKHTCYYLWLKLERVYICCRIITMYLSTCLTACLFSFLLILFNFFFFRLKGERYNIFPFDNSYTSNQLLGSNEIYRIGDKFVFWLLLLLKVSVASSFQKYSHGFVFFLFLSFVRSFHFYFVP